LKCGAGEGWRNQPDRPFEKWRSITLSQVGEECLTYSTKKGG